MSTGFKRLSRQGDEQEQPANSAPAPERVAPKGWGTPKAAAQPANEPAKEAIRARVTPQRQPEPEQEAEAPLEPRRLFSKGVQDALSGADAPGEQTQPETAKPAEEKPAPKPRATRATPQPASPKAEEALEPSGLVQRHLTINISGNAEEVKAALRLLAGL